MGTDFKAIIRESSPRYREWLSVMGTNEFPLKSPIAGLTHLPGRGEVHVLMIDVALLSEEQRARLVKHLAAKFGIEESDVASSLDREGVPILDEDVTVVIFNPQRWLDDTSLETVIWVMDSDICGCGGLIDDWGYCTRCGYDGIDYDEYEDDYIDDEWDEDE
jgi:hypothetical protein